MGRKRKDPDMCPICGTYMDVLCTGYARSPFLNGRKYESICFVCLHVPKIWACRSGRAKDGSDDEWTGPLWDVKSLYTAKELVDDGVCELARARKSVAAVRKLLKA